MQQYNTVIVTAHNLTLRFKALFASLVTKSMTNVNDDNLKGAVA